MSDAQLGLSNNHITLRRKQNIAEERSHPQAQKLLSVALIWCVSITESKMEQFVLTILPLDALYALALKAAGVIKLKNVSPNRSPWVKTKEHCVSFRESVLNANVLSG